MTIGNDPRPLTRDDPRHWVIMSAYTATMIRDTLRDWAVEHPQVISEWAEVDEAASKLEVALDHLDKALADGREPVLAHLHSSFPPG